MYLQPCFWGPYRSCQVPVYDLCLYEPISHIQFVVLTMVCQYHGEYHELKLRIQWSKKVPVLQSTYHVSNVSFFPKFTQKRSIWRFRVTNRLYVKRCVFLKTRYNRAILVVFAIKTKGITSFLFDWVQDP